MKKITLSTLCAIGIMSSLAAQHIESVGDYTYVADGKNQLLNVLDTSNPYHIVKQSTFEVINPKYIEKMYAFDVKGDYVYYSTLTGFGFGIIDATNKNSLTKVGGYSSSGDTDPKDWVSAIVVQGDYAYVSTYMGQDYGLEIINISDKSTPVLTGRYDLGTMSENAFRDVNIVIDGNYVYLGTIEEGIRVLDVSSKSNPTLVGTIGVNGRYHQDAYVGDIKVVNKTLYATTGNGFQIIDVSDINNPTVIGDYFDSNSAFNNINIVVSGEYAYYMDTMYSVLTIVNISNKSNPSSVSSFSFNSEDTERFGEDYLLIDNMSVNGNYIYLTNYKSDSNFKKIYQDMIIVDTTDKLNPVIVEQKDVTSFVKRFYQEVLGRTADDLGLQDWVNKLTSGKSAGSDIARGFVFSDEFTNHTYDDSQTLTILYKAFFNRDPDSGGMDFWLKKIAAGASLETVLDGFLYSDEFANLCKIYGIKPTQGSISPTPTDNPQVEAFVERFYTEVLGRTADSAGLADWTNKLVSGKSAGSDIATGFIFSPEFTSQDKYKNDDLFVKVLYKAFFNREADTAGYDTWLNLLAQGTSKEVVLHGFLYSAEFAALCQSYGITAVK